MNIDGNTQEQTSVPENTAAATQQNDSGTAADPKEIVAAEKPAGEKHKDRLFTRDEVTKILKKRLERNNKKLWSKLGIEGEDKLDEYLSGNAKAAKDLEDSNAKYSELEGKYKQTLRDYLYLKSGVIPEKYADLDGSFENGEMDEEKLAKVLKEHPEFLMPKKTVPQQLGQRQNEQQTRETERELAEKLFHVKF